MAHRSQSSSVGDNPLDPNFLPPHYREEYRMAIDALIENDVQGYLEFLQTTEIPSFLGQAEIQHIKCTCQGPSHSSSVTDLTYHDRAVEPDGSSDTYWPMQSDLAAPGLDLGWPLPQHSFIGPTEVTTLVNPSDPDMPSIKEQARRLIKNAHLVIAVVMDMFTDIDIFSDLLDAAARHVPVYILLDELDAPHFVSMVNNCKVNLEFIPMMRVRTVAGITYYSRTGKSFKGQVKDRFLLVDCKAVLSGNYSFMWSYEKINRCIAHLFLGELVTTFDEEFRILYAQSEPLVVDPSDALALSDTSSTSSYLSSQFGLKRTQSLRNPLSYRRQPELPPAFPYGETDRNLALPFRRNDPFRHTVEPSAGITIGKYSQQQFRLQQSFLEQGRSIVSRQMEMGTSVFKRHSYAEGTQENYTSSRQFMKHRVMNNLDETDFRREQTMTSQFYSEGPGPGSGHGHYDRLRGRPPQLAIDQHSESSMRSDLDLQPGNYAQEYFSSDDLGGPDGQTAPPLAGRYQGGSSNKRPTLGHAYACQSSPTQLHPPEKKYLKQTDQDKDQDPDAKQGMRSWRINSYLSTYEDGGEEGVNQPVGPDAFEEPPQPHQPIIMEPPAVRFGFKEPVTLPSKPEIPRPRYGKPIFPDNKKDTGPTSKDLLPSVSELRPYAFEKKERDIERGPTKEMGVDAEVKEAPELLLSKHESFRSRINPLLQRSSRLRSSLIFSSSKAEMHTGSLGLTPASEQDEELDAVRTSSIVAQILEKRRNREPFEWRKKAEEKEKEPNEDLDNKEKQFQTKEPEQPKNSHVTLDKMKDEPQKTTEETEKTATTETETTSDALRQQQTSTMNMNDPASRLQYFNDLAAKRKASKMGTDTSLKTPEPDEKKPDIAEKPLHTSTMSKVPAPSVPATETEPKKLDITSRLAELTRRPSFSSSKPPIISGKPPSYQKSTDAPQSSKEDGASEGLKKDIFKSLKPLPSPKIFKRDPLKLKGLNPRRISAGEEVMTTDATDAEKSELKKIRSHSSSTLPRDESKDGLKKIMGSNTSINTLGEGKSEGKLDFLKKQTQRLKGILGPKDKEKKSAEDRSMATATEVTGKKTSLNSTSNNAAASATAASASEQSTSTNKTNTGPSRYQAPNSSVLFSSNLRDDTKVILEQISANSQKNRQERGEESGGDSDSADKAVDKQGSLRRNRFLRPHSNTQEREGLLKRIESLRKEKKVYSRFEMGNNLG